MASSPIQMEDLAQAPRRKASQKAHRPPITANPAFPWIVALWFAALLGVGSLIVPIALLETASTASGLASLLPMAAPPLGFTARGLAALVGILAGGSLGLIVARKIAAPKVARVTGVTARKPLIATEDLGASDIDDDDPHDGLPMLAKGRRRALAIEQEDGPSDFLAPVPFPAPPEHGGRLLKVSMDFDADVMVETSNAWAAEDEPFELNESAALTEVAGELPEYIAPDERQEFIPMPHAQPCDTNEPAAAASLSGQPEARATAKEPLPFSPPSMARVGTAEADNPGESDFAAMRPFDPEQDTGPESEDTMSDKQIFHGYDEREVDTFDELHDAPEVDDLHVPAEPGEPVAADRADRDANEDEGLVQLVQRLGATLEKHREWAAQKAARTMDLNPAPLAEALNVAEGEHDGAAAESRVAREFDPAAPEDVSQAMAAYFAASTSAPVPPTETEAESAEAVETPLPVGADRETPRQRYQTFRGTIAAVEFAEDEEDEDYAIADLAASFSLPLAMAPEPAPTPRPAFDRPPPSAEVQAADGAAGKLDEVEETSWLAETDTAPANPFRRNAEEFVRVEEPEPEDGDSQPAVLFPHQQARQPAASPASASPASSVQGFDRQKRETELPPLRTERPRPSNDDNERALREALMNLQRMGK